MLLLFSDILLSYLAKVPIFLFLLNVIIIPKNRLDKLVINSLILDLFFLNGYFIPTIILVIIFIIYKKLRLNRVTFINYIISCSIIFILFTYTLGLINGYRLNNLSGLVFKYYLFNLPIYILCYKLLGKNIKLSR